MVILKVTEWKDKGCNSISILLRLRQLLPLNYRMIHVIKVKKNIDREKLKKMVERTLPNIQWFDSRYNRILSTLLKDFIHNKKDC